MSEPDGRDVPKSGERLVADFRNGIIQQAKWVLNFPFLVEFVIQEPGFDSFLLLDFPVNELIVSHEYFCFLLFLQLLDPNDVFHPTGLFSCRILALSIPTAAEIQL